MPPPAVKTIRDLIYWEYAKLIAGSAVKDRKNWGFVMHIFKKLQRGHMKPSDILRENKLLVDCEKCCVYCGAKEISLEWEHVIPVSRGGPNTIDNQVLACKKCNLEKGARDPFEWYGTEKQYEIPRLVLGKYLKLIFDIHEQAGTLDNPEINEDGELNIFDLGAII